MNDNLEVVDSNSMSQEKNLLGVFDLIGIGVGGTIGAGIFVVTGVVAHSITGPSLFLSFLLAGVASLFSALSYAEFASMSKRSNGSGSAYTYAKDSLGELIGWMIGWDLILEYSVSSGAVAQSFSHHFKSFLNIFNIVIPDSISKPPWSINDKNEFTWSLSVDLIAILITIICTAVTMISVRSNKYFTNGLVAFKILIVLFVIFLGATAFNADNFSPFLPFGFFSWSFFGYTVVGTVSEDGSTQGMIGGAAMVFFSYIGFDAVTCVTSSCRNVNDLPKGIFYSLGISTILYVGVSIVLVGMVPYTKIDSLAPISSAFSYAGMSWADIIISIGALIGIVSVLTVNLTAQPRIFAVMATDGLFPALFHYQSKQNLPIKGSIICCIFAALLASCVPLTILVEFVSIGTLLAFTVVNVAIIKLHYSNKVIERGFICPWKPYVPACGAIICTILMLSLSVMNWIRLGVWLVIGLIIYFSWGKKNARNVLTNIQALHQARALTVYKEESAQTNYLIKFSGLEVNTKQVEMIESRTNDKNNKNKDFDIVDVNGLNKLESLNELGYLGESDVHTDDLGGHTNMNGTNGPGSNNYSHSILHGSQLNQTRRLTDLQI